MTHGKAIVKTMLTMSRGIAIHRYQIAGAVIVVMPKTLARKEMGRKREATTERNFALSLFQVSSEHDLGIVNVRLRTIFYVELEFNQIRKPLFEGVEIVVILICISSVPQKPRG